MRSILNLRALFLFTGAVLFSCTGDEIPQSSWEKLIAIRAEASSCRKEMTLDKFAVATEGKQSRRAEIYRKYHDLFTPQNIELASRIEQSLADQSARRRTGFLRIFLISGYLDKAVYEYGQLSESAGSGAPGSSDITVELAGEPDRERRADLFETQRAAAIERHYRQVEVENISDSLMRSLGYAAAEDFWLEKRHLDIIALEIVVDTFLKQSDSLYQRLFDTFASQLAGIKSDSYRDWDTPRLYRAEHLDRWFDSDSLKSKLRQTLSLLGLGAGSLDTIRFDFRHCGSKPDRAATYPVDVPVDIRVSVKPTGGVQDYAAMLHELGHALNYLYTRERDFEYIYLGDNSIAELSAFLMENLLAEPLYITQLFGLPEDDLGEYLKYRAFIRLFMVRSACADFLFELELTKSQIVPADHFAVIREKILGYPTSEIGGYLYPAHDDRFASADYLRAWFLSAQLRKKFRAAHGSDYFLNDDYRETLKRLWRGGRSLSLEEVAGLFLDETNLSSEALMDEINVLANWQ